LVGVTPSSPVPFEERPLVYEWACGGTDTRDDDPRRQRGGLPGEAQGQLVLPELEVGLRDVGPASAATRASPAEELLQQRAQRRHVTCRRLPHGLEVESEVFVSGDVTHATHLAPRDNRSVSLCSLRVPTDTLDRGEDVGDP
jgi:hypothetical protein